ncbi:ADP-ribosylation factor-like protein 14 isoform X2 [Chrysemys picta bellii]|uniref:ADP-ribosylation factor-like protein 14 isoform X2 n=1 Tax=Chrysemys picta bellii TaxID=8478 RepID=UPI0032B2507C
MGLTTFLNMKTLKFAGNLAHSQTLHLGLIAKRTTSRNITTTLSEELLYRSRQESTQQLIYRLFTKGDKSIPVGSIAPEIMGQLK